MENKRISIIIPVYNSENYLRDCMDSILSQVCPNDEIIMINDASTDQSLSICYLYQDKYSEIVKVINKDSKSGPSDSRNIGTERAKGTYAYYVDSDDWLSIHALDLMYKFAVEKDCDIVQGGFYYAYKDYLLLDKRYKQTYTCPQVISKECAMAHLIRDGVVNNFIWGKLYKTSLVKKYKFPVDISMGEDLYWQHLIIHASNQIGIIPQPLYFYRQNSLSLSNVFSERHIDLLYAYESRLSFIKKEYPSLSRDMLFSYWKQAYQSMTLSKKSGSAKCQDAFCRYWKDLNNRYHDELKKNIKLKLEYLLYNQSEELLKAYLFLKQIHIRFLPRYKKVDYDR